MKKYNSFAELNGKQLQEEDKVMIVDKFIYEVAHNHLSLREGGIHNDEIFEFLKISKNRKLAKDIYGEDSAIGTVFPAIHKPYLMPYRKRMDLLTKFALVLMGFAEGMEGVSVRYGNKWKTFYKKYYK